MRGLLSAAPRRLVYVSCHEATLARDLKQLGRTYRLDSLDFLDLFPQTAHLETVACLRRFETGSPDRATVAEAER